MDDADRAQDVIYSRIADGMAKARRELESHLPATGYCYWCESEVSAGRVYCSKECYQDHSKQMEANRRNGT